MGFIHFILHYMLLVFLKALVRGILLIFTRVWAALFTVLLAGLL